MAHKMYRDEEDADFDSTDDELVHNVQGTTSGLSSPRRALFVALGSLALVGCAMVAYAQASPTAASGRQPSLLAAPHSARELMQSGDFAEVATDNIMRARGDIYTSSDRAKVRAHVDEGLAHVQQLLAENPQLLSDLEAVHLSTEQRGAVLELMRHLTNPRVQRLGLHVARALQSSPSDDPAVMKKHVIEKMQGDVPEVRRLSNEIVPASLRSLWAKQAGDWDMDLNADKVRQLRTFDGKWDERLEPSKQSSLRSRQLQSFAPTTAAPAPLVKSEEALGIVMAVVDQLRALWDIMRPMAKLFGKDLNMNVWATSGVGAGAAIFKLVSCALDGVADGYNMVELASCPMQVGSEGMDAIRGVLATLGVLGDNNGKNGHSGAHNGQGDEDGSAGSGTSSGGSEDSKDSQDSQDSKRRRA